MGLEILTLGSSKTYTRESLLGLGAVKGAPCTIKSITEVDGGQKVTFEWTGTSGTKQTSEMTVKNGVSVTGISDKGNGKFTLLLSDGSESDPIQTIKGQKGDKGDKLTFNDLTDEEKAFLKGDSGFSPTITENENNTDKIYKLDVTTADGTFTTPNLKGKDGSGSSTGEENVIESIKVNGVVQTVADDKSVDITVPTVDVDKKYVDTELAKKANTSDIPSLDGYAKTSEIPSKVSELENDSNYLSSIPEEYVTETELSAKGYLTEHQDISGKVDKVDGKSLIADTEIERLASVDNYDDTQVKTQIQAVANGLMDSVGYSADYKTIDIIAKNGVKKSVNVAPIISHASITELSDVDTTNKATGKALVYNATTSKHEYADVSGTDEKVKMDSSTDAKYLGELLDNVTIANENGELKVKKLDGQEVTITEINYLKGLTMNVMDLVNMFSNGGVKIINTPVATYAELLTLDKSSFIEGISYLVYVLADENHDNAKTTYLVDKDSETPTYFGFADSQRDFTTNPIDLATEITGKLGISNMDSDAIKALFTVDDTYKTETTTNNAFSTHGAKALYDELLLAIGNKANSSDLTAHKDDTDIHVSTEDRTNWDSAKTHADSAHAPSNAQENVLESVKVNGTALTPSSKAVNVTVPTTVAELTDSADYAKKTDIPTELPANGGNANTVNNHTVKSDVPVDAKFTDTIYDDTKVKGSITTLNSNLDTLEHSDVAGGKNICKASDNDVINEITLIKKDVSTIIISGASDSRSISKDFNVKKGVTYTATFFTSSTNVIGFLWNSIEKNVAYNFGSSKTITFTPTEDLTLSFAVTLTATVSNVEISMQVEKGSKSTSFEPYIPSVKMLADEVSTQNESLGALGKCKNLLIPKLQTTTQNGITCTNNGDGTYTFNGTATSNVFFDFNKNIPINKGTKYKVVCFKDEDYVPNKIMSSVRRVDTANAYTFNNGSFVSDTENCWLFVDIEKGVTVSNLVAKPTITTNLNATYDDFVPYTGDGETLTHDVAEIKKDLVGLEFGENSGGKNLFNINDKGVGLYYENKSYNPNYTHTFVRVKPSTQYTFSSSENFTSGYYLSYMNWDTIIESKANLANDQKKFTITTPSNCNVIWIYIHDKANLQIEEGTTPTPYEPYIPSIKMLTDEVSVQNKNLSVIGKCKNLLNPTLQTTTQNGVTCTNNGDGTYTLNGTASNYTNFILVNQGTTAIKQMIDGKTFKVIGFKETGNYRLECTAWLPTGGTYVFDSRIWDVPNGAKGLRIDVVVLSGATLNDVVVKPMLTTDLSATYDDFVPYTGDGETLASDVAEIKNDLGGLTFSASGTTLTITDGTNTWTLGANS